MNVLIPLAIGILSFLGGGTFLNRGQVEIKTDIATLKAESTGYREDIGEVKSDIKEIKSILNDWARSQNLTRSKSATSTPVQ